MSHDHARGSTPLSASGARRQHLKTAGGLALLFAALTTLHLWPMPSDPAHLTRLDNNDTAFNTWVIAWVAHQITRDPLGLFNAPIFFPARDALAFSEHMVTQSILSLPLAWSGLSPVTIYNAMVWLGHASSGFAMALLLRAWTGSTIAGVVAGCLYSFNAHLLTRYAHLQALHMEFFPVALYAFDRVLRGAGARAAALLAVMFVVQALCSNYTLVLTAAALLAALIVRPEPWRWNRRVWIPLVCAGAAAVAALLPFLLPYYRVRETEGLIRTIDDVRHYSAGWRDYLATASRLHYDLWSHRTFPGSTALFPGVAGFALTVGAVGTGIAWNNTRARMAVAFGVVGFALSLGANLPGYDWMQQYIPLVQGIRAAARWGGLVLVAVAVLAGFAVAELERRWVTRRWWTAFAVGLVAIVTIEALRAPLPMQRFDGIAAVHSRIGHEDINAMVVFPLYGGAEFNLNAGYLLDQTKHWTPMLNAYSSFAPRSFYELATKLQSFPDASALRELRTHGFSHVVLHRAPLERDFGKPAVDSLRAHPELEFVLEQDGVIMYRVR